MRLLDHAAPLYVLLRKAAKEIPPILLLQFQKKLNPGD
jgi:hypothetical protein